jgi:hypothetical protein
VPDRRFPAQHSQVLPQADRTVVTASIRQPLVGLHPINETLLVEATDASGTGLPGGRSAHPPARVVRPCVRTSWNDPPRSAHAFMHSTLAVAGQESHLE